MNRNRNRNKKKRKIKIGPIIIALLVLIIIVLTAMKILDKGATSIIYKTYYLASTENSITLYTYNSETDKMEENDKFPRGTKIKSNNNIKTVGEVPYKEIILNDKTYYLSEIYLEENQKSVVKEKEKYVRTSVTVYKNELDSKIESFIKKGNKIEIIDYDNIDNEGYVNMYKIKKDDIIGWVYAKYLVDTEEAALANYNENNVYDTHKDRKYGRELYGGKASTLDYYPYEKPEFENNPILKNAKSMYLNAGSNVIGNIDKYLEIATTSGVNAIVVDLKDGALAYPMEVAKEYSMTAYNTAINSYD